MRSIFRIKKTILFPLIYFALFLLGFSFGSEGMVMLLSAPGGLPLLFIEVQSGMAPGTLTGGSSIVLPIILCCIPYLLFGLMWDLIARYFRNKSISGD